MVLETLAKGRPLNIRNLAIEGPRPPLPEPKFVLERDIPPDIKEAICEKAKSVSANYDPLNVYELGIARMLYPKELAGLVLTDQRAQETLYRIEATTNADMGDGREMLLSYWPYLKALSPSLPSPFTQSELESWVNKCREKIEAPDASLADFRWAIERLIGLKLLVPEKTANLKPDPMPTEVFSKAAYLIDKARLRISLWPEPLSEAIIDEDWESYLYQLQFNLTTPINLWAAVHDALSMQILAADELRITDNGVETIFHDKPTFQTEPPPLPEVRRF